MADTGGIMIEYGPECRGYRYEIEDGRTVELGLGNGPTSEILWRLKCENKGNVTHLVFSDEAIQAIVFMHAALSAPDAESVFAEAVKAQATPAPAKEG